MNVKSNSRVDAEVLVCAEGVSKKFCRSLKKSLWYGLCDIGGELSPFGRQARGNSPVAIGDRGETGLRDGEFWAVYDVSFELRRGECLGLIGRNGAGKTTLLKMLNGLIKPDTGTITMRGRVSALIALGAGFNPILTGRENIYINGPILGLSKSEIDMKIDEIIEFAEVRDFIDSPVQSYSSGMQVRLGFAVASSLSPDILILDEVLAVGDAAFRAKCYRRISEMRRNSAVIFVSHNMHQVARICDRGLTLSNGRAVFVGGIEKSIECYEKLNQSGPDDKEGIVMVHPPLKSFVSKSLMSVVQTGTTFALNIEWEADGMLDDFLVRIVFINSSSVNVADTTYISKSAGVCIRPGTGTWRLETTPLPFKNGKYSLSVTIIDDRGNIVGWSLRQVFFEITGGSPLAITDCHLPAGKWIATKPLETAF